MEHGSPLGGRFEDTVVLIVHDYKAFIVITVLN